MHVYFQTDGQGGIGASTRPNATKLGSFACLMKARRAIKIPGCQKYRPKDLLPRCTIISPFLCIAWLTIEMAITCSSRMGIRRG